MSETAWRGLLQDLLDMQQNVYTCLKPETCHQVRHYSDIMETCDCEVHPVYSDFNCDASFS